MVNLSTHRVPVTCDTQPVQSLVLSMQFCFFSMSTAEGLSSKSEGFQIKYRYWPA